MPDQPNLGTGLRNIYDPCDPDTKPPSPPVLLPCPFCGKDPEWVNHFGVSARSGSVCVACRGCGTNTRWEGYDDVEENLVRRATKQMAMLVLAGTWNHRTTQTKPTLPKRDLVRFFRQGQTPSSVAYVNQEVDDWIEDMLCLHFGLAREDCQDTNHPSRALCDLRNREGIKLFQDSNHYFLTSVGRFIGFFVPPVKP